MSLLQVKLGFRVSRAEVGQRPTTLDLQGPRYAMVQDSGARGHGAHRQSTAALVATSVRRWIVYLSFCHAYRNPHPFPGNQYYLTCTLRVNQRIIH